MQDYQAHAAYKINGKWCIKITKAAKVRAGTGQACITSCRSAADASPDHAAPPSLVTYTNRPLDIEGGTRNVSLSRWPCKLWVVTSPWMYNLCFSLISPRSTSRSRYGEFLWSEWCLDMGGSDGGWARQRDVSSFFSYLCIFICYYFYVFTVLSWI